MMDVHIDLHVEWGDLFGGNFQWPMAAQLEFARRHFLLYVNLVDGRQPLDLPKLLNQAFRCDLPEGFLLLPRAGFFTYAAMQAGGASEPLSQVFPDAPLPPAVKNGFLPVSRAACLWLSVELPEITLFRRLVEIGYGGQTTIELSVLIYSSQTQSPKEAFENAELRAKLPDMRLFDLFAFSGVELVYAWGKGRRFSIGGDIALRVFATDCGFRGALSVDETYLSARLESTGSARIPKLFGGAMPGIAFEGIQFAVEHVFTAGEVPSATLLWLQGSVSLGGLSLTGQLYLVGGTPILARIAMNQSLSIGKLISQCIPGASWPGSLVELTFLAGSELYYLDAGRLPPLPDPLDYQRGFHIHAKLKFTLFYEFYVTGHIRIADTGVEAGIVLGEPIDLYLLQLGGKGGTGGPQFGLSTVGGGASMYFACGLRFLQSYCGDVTVSCGKNAQGQLAVSGSLVLSADLKKVLGNQDPLQFSYSKQDGLRMQGWQSFAFAYEAKKMIDRLRDLMNHSGGGACGAITDFVCKDFLTGNFTVKPAFESAGAGMALVLDGSYTFFSYEEKLFTLNFPKLARIALPAQFSWRELPTYMENALEGIIESLLQCLLDNPEQFAILGGILIGKEAMKQALNMVCRKLIDAAVAAALCAAAESFLEASAGGASGAAATKAAGKAARKSLEDDPPGPRPDPGTPPDPPGRLTVELPRNELHVSWTAAPGAERYRIRLVSERNTLYANDVGYATCELNFLPPASGEAGLSVRVSSGQSNVWSGERVFPLVPLAAPRLTLTYEEAGGLVLTWLSSPDRTAWTIRYLYEGRPFREEPCIGTPSVTVDLSDPAFQRGGRYSCMVRANHVLSALSSAWSNAGEWTRGGALRSTAVECSEHEAAISLRWEDDGTTQPRHDVWLYNSRAQTMRQTVDSAPPFRVVLPLTYGTGLYQFYARTLPSGGLAIPGVWSVATPFEMSFRQLAARARHFGLSAADCARLLCQDDPSIDDLMVTDAMALVGYAQAETVRALHVVFPQVPLETRIYRTVQIYLEPPSLAEIAALAFEEAVSGGDCVPLSVRFYSDATPLEVAVAMAQAVYPMVETGRGLKAVWQRMSAAELAEVLLKAYDTPTTMEELAAEAFAQGKSGAECGKKLIAEYPQAGALALARAMKHAGYDRAAAGDGLRAALPQLSEETVRQALEEIYAES